MQCVLETPSGRQKETNRERLTKPKRLLSFGVTGLCRNRPGIPHNGTAKLQKFIPVGRPPRITESLQSTGELGYVTKKCTWGNNTKKNVDETIKCTFKKETMKRIGKYDDIKRVVCERNLKWSEIWLFNWWDLMVQGSGLIKEWQT